MLEINKKLGTTFVTFTPAYFRQAFKQYEDGDYRPLIRLIEKAEVDSMISGCLTGRKAGFARDWRISEGGTTPTDIEAKEFIEQILLNLDMNYLFRSIFQAVTRKYSVIDLTWDIQNTKQVITDFNLLHQKYFRYDLKDGKLKIDWGTKLIEIEKDSALVCEYRENPVLLSPLRDYILKEFGLESWSSFIETFGEPLVIGTYPQGADTKFISELEAGVRAVSASTRGVAPEGSDIKIIEAHKNTGDHEKYVSRADKSIAISILGHADAVEGSKSGIQVGDNQSSFRVRREIAIDDIRFIEGQISKLVKMLCDRNFTLKKYPVFTIDKSEPINVSERLKVLDSAYDKGLKINPKEYGLLGLYIYDDQKELVNPLVLGD